MSRSYGSLARFVVLFACAACPPPPDPSARAKAFCIDSTTHTLDVLVRCGAWAPVARDSALARARPCELDPARRFDPDAGARCLQQLDALDCASEFPSSCEQVFVGTLEVNSPCFDGQCAPGLTCDVSATCPGVCTAPAAAGEPATRACDATSASWNGRCVARLAEGTACGPPDGSVDALPCDEGLACSADGLCTRVVVGRQGEYCDPNFARTCALGLQCVGDGCTPLSSAGGSCAFPSRCQAGLDCTASRVCQSQHVVGESCSAEDPCVPTSFCSGEPGVATGECRARLTEGAACLSTEGAESVCAAGLSCVPESAASAEGVCHARLARGAECFVNSETTVCANGLFCSASALVPTGACVDQKQSGRCSRDVECRSFWCQDDGGCLPVCLAPPP